jgi:hypothetical protein
MKEARERKGGGGARGLRVRTVAKRHREHNVEGPS